jgi:acetolactate synthase small subunit
LFQEPVPLERSTRNYGRQQLPRDLNVYASLVLECENEGLSEVQLKVQNEAKAEFKQAHDKINEMIKNQTVRVLSPN